MGDVVYLCDRKACTKCSKGCNYTSNVEHAVNFECLGAHSYWEKKKERGLRGLWKRIKSRKTGKKTNT